MNLQEIQKRLEELSAEMLTLSNAIARVVGTVPTVVAPLVDFTQLTPGQDVTISEAFTIPWTEDDLEAGTYAVVQVEEEGYNGKLSVMIDIGDRTVWINMQELIRQGIVTIATI
ncbi:hypothetical protein vBPFY1MI_63 [Pseudomonas phage vB_PF_Y1-MI]|nr:hypothetical protein vBPFY1MI_63 [Pseudomonas phage vB_PF_Y1-MI]